MGTGYWKMYTSERILASNIKLGMKKIKLMRVYDPENWMPEDKKSHFYEAPKKWWPDY